MSQAMRNNVPFGNAMILLLAHKIFTGNQAPGKWHIYRLALRSAPVTLLQFWLGNSIDWKKGPEMLNIKT
jgi:hypothetical protein